MIPDRSPEHERLAAHGSCGGDRLASTPASRALHPTRLESSRRTAMTVERANVPSPSGNVPCSRCPDRTHRRKFGIRASEIRLLRCNGSDMRRFTAGVFGEPPFAHRTGLVREVPKCHETLSMENRTTVTFSHDMGAAVGCTIFVDRGGIAEDGSPDDVLGARGGHTCGCFC